MADSAPLVAFWTDRGPAHPENEDVAAAGRLCAGYALVLADGMGGRDKSSMAARIAVNTVGSVLDEGAASEGVMRRALTSAHANIQALSARDGSRRLGAACAVVVVDGGRIWIANTGDVRIYRVMQTGGIARLSHDQTLLQQRLDREELAWSESFGHPDGRVLSGFLGQRGNLSAMIEDAPVPLRPGDRVVLCTDGVSSVLRDSEIGQIAARDAPEEAARTLVQRARERGSRDDATAIVAQPGAGGDAVELPFGLLELPPPPEASVLDRSVVVQAVRRRDRKALVLGIAGAVVVTGLAVALYRAAGTDERHEQGAGPPAVIDGLGAVDEAPDVMAATDAGPAPDVHVRPETVVEALAQGAPQRRELLDILQGAHRQELLAHGKLPPLAADDALPQPLPKVLDAARPDDERVLILQGYLLELVLDRDVEALRRLDAELTVRVSRPEVARMMVRFVEVQTEPLFQRWGLEQLRR